MSDCCIRASTGSGVANVAWPEAGCAGQIGVVYEHVQVYGRKRQGRNGIDSLKCQIKQSGSPLRLVTSSRTSESLKGR